MADQILELIPGEREMAALWMAEAGRRFEELDQGLVKSVPWSEARDRLFEKQLSRVALSD